MLLYLIQTKLFQFFRLFWLTTWSTACVCTMYYYLMFLRCASIFSLSLPLFLIYLGNSFVSASLVFCPLMAAAISSNVTLSNCNCGCVPKSIYIYTRDVVSIFGYAFAMCVITYKCVCDRSAHLVRGQVRDRGD